MHSTKSIQHTYIHTQHHQCCVCRYVIKAIGISLQYITTDDVVNTTHGIASLTYLLRGDSSWELGRGWSCSTLADLGLFPALLPCSPGVLLEAPLEGVRGGREEDCLWGEPKARDTGVCRIDCWGRGRGGGSRNTGRGHCECQCGFSHLLQVCYIVWGQEDISHMEKVLQTERVHKWDCSEFVWHTGMYVGKHMH